MFFSQDKLPNSEIPTAFNKNFAEIFNFDSYGGTISTYAALELEFVSVSVSSLLSQTKFWELGNPQSLNLMVSWIKYFQKRHFCLDYYSILSSVR